MERRKSLRGVVNVCLHYICVPHTCICISACHPPPSNLNMNVINAYEIIDASITELASYRDWNGAHAREL